MADGGDILGSVEVEVRANLDKLLAGFAQGQAAAARFDKAVGEKSAAAAKRFDDATAASAGSLSKQNAAAKASAEAVQAGAAASDRAASEMERSATAASMVDDAASRAGGAMATLGSAADTAGSTVQANMEGIAGSVDAIDTHTATAATSMDTLAAATGQAATASGTEAAAAETVSKVLDGQVASADALGAAKEHSKAATEGHAAAAEHAATAVRGETKAIDESAGSMARADQSTIKVSGSLETLKGAARGVGVAVKDEVGAISDMGIPISKANRAAVMSAEQLTNAIGQTERAAFEEAKASGAAAAAITQQAAAEKEAAAAATAKAAGAAQAARASEAEAAAAKSVGAAAGAAAGELNKQAAAGINSAASADKAASAINREGQALDGSAAAIAKKIQGDAALEGAMTRMIGSYDRIHIAVARYEQDLQDIARLEKAGVISTRQATRYRLEAEKSYDRAARAVRGMGNAHATAARGMSSFNAILGAVTVGSLIAAGKHALEFAGNIKDMSEELGMSTTKFQEWQYVAQQTGVKATDMEQSFRQLSKTIGEAATGSEKDQKLLKAFGFTLADIKSGTIDVNDVLPKLADKLAGIHSPALKAQILIAAFGESGQKMARMLEGGSERIDGLRQAAHDLGVVLSEEDIKNADETAKKLGQVKAVLEAEFASVVAKNSSSILGLADALGTLTGSILKFMNSNPEAAMAIIGGIAGLRTGGIIGGAIGVVGGAYVGRQMSNARDTANSDLGFRTEQFRQARTRRDQMNASLTPDQRRGTAPLGPAVIEARRELNRQGVLLAGAIADTRTKIQKAKPLTKEQIAADAKAAKEFAFLHTPKGPKGPKGPSAETLAKRAEAERKRALDREQRYQDQLAQAEDEYLSLQMEMSTDNAEIAKLKTEQINREEALRDKEITNMADTGDIPGGIKGAQAEQLRLENERNSKLKRELIARDLAEKVLEETTNNKQDQLQGEIQILQSQSDISDSASKRKEIALSILDKEIEIQLLKQDEIIASSETNDAKKAIAELEKKRLLELQANKTKAVEKEHQTPMQRFQDELAKTPEEIDTELQNIEAGSLRALIDGLAEAGLNWKKMGDVAKQVLNQIVTDLIRLQLEAAMSAVIGKPGGGGGILGSLFGLAGAAFGGGGFSGMGGVAASAPLGINLGAGSLFDSIPMTVLHDGAINAHAGSGPMRSLPAQAFIGAPRYHKGLGIKGDEFPAILQKGETIIPKGKFGRGGGARGSGGLHMSIGAINVSGAMNNRDARMTARQIVSQTQGRMALASRYGFKKK